LVADWQNAVAPVHKNNPHRTGIASRMAHPLPQASNNAQESIRLRMACSKQRRKARAARKRKARRMNKQP
jgi:hypothetical protein